MTMILQPKPTVSCAGWRDPDQRGRGRNLLANVPVFAGLRQALRSALAIIGMATPKIREGIPMNLTVTTSPRQDASFASLFPFLLIAFGLAWGLFSLLFIVPQTLEGIFGPVSTTHPLFITAVYSPAIAAVVLVLWFGGLRGLGQFLSRLLLWRCHPGWYAVLLVVIPLAFFAGSAVKGNLTELTFPFPSFWAMLGAMAFMAILGPMEEVGWRGYALPLLQRVMTPFMASIMLGLIWGLWHFPAFMLGGTPQSDWSFLPFFIGTVSVSLIVTPMFNASKGSILLPVLFHFQLNNPLWPDAQPYDTIFFAAAAAVIVWLNRGTMFSRKVAVTEVIPG